MIGLMSPMAARADLTHKLTSSVQLQVDAGYTQYHEQVTLIAPVDLVSAQLLHRLVVVLLIT